MWQFKRFNTSSSINTDEAKPGFDTKNELETRTNTICADANWRLLSASGQCCDVNVLHNKFKGTKEMYVAKVATEICNEHGHVQILIVNQSIYFWARLDHSNINPNQTRNFGIPVSENLYNS